MTWTGTEILAVALGAVVVVSNVAWLIAWAVQRSAARKADEAACYLRQEVARLGRAEARESERERLEYISDDVLLAELRGPRPSDR